MPCGSLSLLEVIARPDFPDQAPYQLRTPLPIGVQLILLRLPIAQTLHGWLPNINGIPIAYAFRPELRDRLTLGGLTFPRKP
jgi:hypothetical protein